MLWREIDCTVAIKLCMHIRLVSKFYSLFLYILYSFSNRLRITFTFGMIEKKQVASLEATVMMISRGG